MLQKQAGRASTSHEVGRAPQLPVGKQTLVQQQPTAAQAAPDAAASGDAVHAAAAHGVSGTARELPHRDSIQRLFGRHDVSSVGAHVGGAAAEGAGRMGASAYATGDQVAFAAEPDLHTAAHEAAHVVQQRAGVQLYGGVGTAGDRYEQHADAVADLVVQGKSAEGVLDQHAPAASGTAVQRAAIQRMERDGASAHTAPSTPAAAGPQFQKVPLKLGLIHGHHDQEPNIIDLHVSAKSDGAGLGLEDMLAMAKHSSQLMLSREEEGGPQGQFKLRPQGAAIVKIVVELLGEALGGTWNKNLARGKQYARKQGLSPGRGEPKSGEKLHSSVLPEHFSYIDSLQGTDGVAMAPLTTGDYRPNTMEEFEQNMLEKTPKGRARLAQYKGQLNDPEEEYGPSMDITLSSVQLPKVIQVLNSQRK